MENQKILVCDDDTSLCNVLRDYLQFQGFAIDLFHNIHDARPSLLKNRYDVILLDWDMPGGSGVQLCREFRDSGGMTPVLMMTGRTALEEKEEGLESGADDYLTKPFAMRELHARIKSMLRRSSSYTAAVAATPAPTNETTEIRLEPRPGLVLAGKYRLEEPIASGGMAIVWRAKDISIERSVVVKIMHDVLVNDGENARRFEHESKVMAKIKHPNVVTIYDVGNLHGKIPYLVMEHVQGVCLRDLIQDFGAMSVSTAAVVVKQICAGLQEAHDEGIVHRDLKPENILIQDRSFRVDSVKIVDFGIARLLDSKERLTRDGMIVGTLEYMSPEQLEDAPVDGRADIYALGVILFELLTGDLPFKARTMEGLISKHLVAVPPAVSTLCKDVPSGSALDRIVAKCLAKKPEDRFQKADDLKTALDECVDG